MKEVVMRRTLFSVVAGLAIATLVHTAALAQGTKTVRGTITAIGSASVTVSVDGKEMVFNVDAKTDITTPGGTTKTRAAQAQGKEGLKLNDYLKQGQGVEVHYHEQGMHAAQIRTLSSPPAAGTGGPPAPPAPKAQNVNGTVTAVATNSITVKTASGEQTFTVDDKTDVVATGASTATAKKKAAGEKTVITDFVGVGDTVVVTYHESGAAKNASEVRVRAKARK
jgi:hypothetical protein